MQYIAVTLITISSWNVLSGLVALCIPRDILKPESKTAP